MPSDSQQQPDPDVAGGATPRPDPPRTPKGKPSTLSSLLDKVADHAPTIGRVVADKAPAFAQTVADKAPDTIRRLTAKSSPKVQRLARSVADQTAKRAPQIGK